MSMFRRKSLQLERNVLEKKGRSESRRGSLSTATSISSGPFLTVPNALGDRFFSAPAPPHSPPDRHCEKCDKYDRKSEKFERHYEKYHVDGGSNTRGSPCRPDDRGDRSPSSTERRSSLVVRWFRHFQETQASINDSSKDGGRGNRRAQQPSSSHPQEHDSDVQPPQDRDGGEDSLDDSEAADSGEGPTTPGTSANNNNNATDSPQDSFAKKTDSNDVSASNSTASGAGASAGRAGGGSARRLQEVQIIQIVEDTPLISPSEVTVSQGVVLSAQPVLTPIEHLRRKDLKIKQTLKEKQHIIADILDIPREHFGTLGDMASEPGSGPKEPRELVLAAIYQANCLQETLNEVLTIKESDIVAAKAGGPESASKLGSSHLPLFPAPMNKLLGIAGSLSDQLNAILNLVSERDDERDRMRKELVASRERMHQLHLNQSPGGASISSHSSATPTNSRPNSIVSQTSTPAPDIRDDSETVSADERVRGSSTQEDLTDLIAREAQEEGEGSVDGTTPRQPGAEASVCTDDDAFPESSREESSDLEQPQHHLPTT
ncbi:hypothetical protein FHG87_004967 [Trinorchestia longiramus]|nr:hypothetical protein FHG87_004967 [Trinorchestia longiramus]